MFCAAVSGVQQAVFLVNASQKIDNDVDRGDNDLSCDEDDDCENISTITQ